MKKATNLDSTATGNLDSTNTGDQIDLSVVLPVYKEAQALKKLIPELMDKLKDLKLSFEVIVVNLFVKNGDGSYQILKKFGDKYSELYPVNIKYLATNANTQKGEQYRLGFELARGKYVIQMDSDYQDNPADLDKFIEKLVKGYDLVVGWKQDRKDPFFYKLTSKIQNGLTRLLSGIELHDKNCGFKGYSQAAVESLRLYGLNFRDIPMQLASRGFTITEVPIDNRKRDTGENKFNFKSRLIGGTVDFTCDLVMSKLEETPFRFWSLVGFGTLLLGVGAFFLFLIESVFSILSLVWVSNMLMMFSGVLLILAVMFVLTGFIMQYMIDQRGFEMDRYFIEDDYKGITERLSK
jgi:dolichol-phosphate mannosyltransferase